MKAPFVDFIKSSLGSQVLLITCGLPASFKTTASEAVAKIKGYSILRSDLIRLEVLKHEDVFNVNLAANMNTRLLVYEELFRRANTLAKEKKGGIILDATFITQELRRRAAEIANEYNLDLVILQTCCPQDLSLLIIQKRKKETYTSNALTPEAYFNNKEQFEPIDVDDLKKHYPTLNLMYLSVETCCEEIDCWSIIDVQKR